MKIGTWDSDRSVFVIAEIGNNHEGRFDVAQEMICRAADAGANAVKFQKIVPEKFVSSTETGRLSQLRKFQLTCEQFESLAKLATEKRVAFLSTPFDLDSATFLAPWVPAFKISSGDNNFYALLSFVARFGKPMMISTGLADAEQVAKTIAAIKEDWTSSEVTERLALLHCVTSYPTAPREANLAAIGHLKSFGCLVGYSDHTMGIEAAVLSVAAGARIIEKHFTLDNNFSAFRDHALSANPADFQVMVRRIREAEEYMGSGEIEVTESEKTVLSAVRRSIAVREDIPQGTEITAEMLTWLRPGIGFPPGEEDMVLGKISTRALKKGELFSPKDLESRSIGHS